MPGIETKEISNGPRTNLLQIKDFFGGHIFRFLGLVILAAILIKIDFRQSISVIKGAHLYVLAMAILLYLPKNLILVYKWRILLEQQGIDIPFRRGFLIYFASYFWGFTTPGRAGELLRTKYLKNEGYFYRTTLFTILVEKFFDVALIIPLGCVGIYLFFCRFPLVVILTSALIITFILCFLFKFSWISSVLEKTIVRFAPNSMHAWILSILRDYNLFVRELKSLSSSFFLLLNITWWAIHFLQMYLLVKSLNIPVSYLNIVLAFSMVGFANMIPISVAGLGTRDAVILLTFNKLGFAAETAFAFALMVSFVIFINFLFSFSIWQINPVKFHLRNNQ